MKKGLLDAFVLRILSKGDTYGYKLTQEITGLMEVSESALYPVLRRLESQGCLETYSAEHSAAKALLQNNREGKSRLEEYIRELAELKNS